MAKNKVLFTLFFILSISISYAQNTGVGIGISTYSINITGSILDYYVSNIRIINPSVYEVKAKIYFECRDCTTDVNLFGKKIAEKTVDYRNYFILDKNDLTIPPMSLGDKAPAVKIIFSPKFINKNYLKIYTPEAINFFIKLINKKYENNFVLPYYSLFIGEKSINGLIVAEVYSSSFGPLGVTPSVGSKMEIHAKGMPWSSFIILCCLIILTIIFIIKKIKSNHLKKEKHK
ncbi:MAG: hypothetical protein KQA41_04275 [Candidatus Aenigmarchaeota archaeon]|nr:hypothetical protein [Candidatus Aenigmarchaeota archaeon]